MTLASGRFAITPVLSLRHKLPFFGFPDYGEIPDLDAAVRNGVHDAEA